MDKSEESMKLEDLIEALDQRYGNPYASKENALIQEAVKQLRVVLQKTQGESDEKCNGK